MIGPGFLQRPLHAFVQPSAVADDDSRHNRRGSGVPTADGVCDCPPGKRANGRKPLVDPRSTAAQFDKRSTLGRPDERGAAHQQPALTVRDADIEIPRRPVQFHGQPHAPACRPLTRVFGGQRTGDGHQQPALDIACRARNREWRDPLDVQAQRDARQTRRRIGAQDAINDGERRRIFGHESMLRVGIRALDDRGFIEHLA